jgi:hypothetical protein
MVRRRFVPLLFFGITAASSVSIGSRETQIKGTAPENHDAWVESALTRMLTIHAGMTRNDLLKVFTTEGGISTGLQRTYVSRDCSYFKVDVEFNAVGRPNRDSEGRVTLVEDGKDIIIKISWPRIAFSNLA